LGDRKGIRPVKKTGCWFVGGDDLTGALHDFCHTCCKDKLFQQHNVDEMID